MVTPCTHSFHNECLMDWVNTKVKKACEDLDSGSNAYGLLIDEGPHCPNCNESIILGKKVRLMNAAMLSPIKENRGSFLNDLVRENSNIE